MAKIAYRKFKSNSQHHNGDIGPKGRADFLQGQADADRQQVEGHQCQADGRMAHAQFDHLVMQVPFVGVEGRLLERQTDKDHSDHVHDGHDEQCQDHVAGILDEMGRVDIDFHVGCFNGEDGYEDPDEHRSHVAHENLGR